MKPSHSALVCLLLAACGGSPGAPPATATDAVASDDSSSASDVASDSPGATDAASDVAAADAPTDAAATDSASASDGIAVNDASSDAADGAKPDPLASLGSCLGASSTLTVSSQMPYVSVPVGTYSGQFLVDLGSTYSSIDLKAFSAPGPATSGCDPTKLGVTCTVAGFSFFSSPGSVFLVTEDFSGITGSVRQAGIIGTDFTSLKVLTFSYASGRMFAASSSASFCSASALSAAGFAPLSTTGYYSNNLSSLLPASTVDSAATGGSVPNVPTVPVQIGGVSAIAQLDTGFDDALVHFSINVNQAFYGAIVAKDSGALVRDAAHDLSLSTCAGVSEPVTAYKLGTGRTLALVDKSGAVARSYPTATIFVKNTPPAAHKCGGIGTWTAPAAQMAASFFVDMGNLIADPYSSTIWVAK